MGILPSCLGDSVHYKFAQGLQGSEGELKLESSTGRAGIIH